VSTETVSTETVSTEAVPGELDAVLVALLTTAEGRQDPYPSYERLRREAPVFQSAFGPIVLTRYEDCQQLLRNPAFGKPAGEEEVRQARQARLARSGLEEADVERLVEFFSTRQSMLTLNPPDHTRLRRLVSRAFTPRRVEELRPEIERLADALLDEMERTGSDATKAIDVMSALAFRLPVAVIGELVGVPEQDRMRFQSLVRASTAVLEPASDLPALERAIEARLEMEDYFEHLVARRRVEPADDLLSDLIAARDGSDALSEEELISTAILLFAAGFETTTNLIGNGLFALLSHREQWERLCSWHADDQRVKLAVEELLRYDSPVQIDGRVALEDTDAMGISVEAGQGVITLLGAANRDPGRFREPDELVLARDEGPPLSFASGIHSCLGAPLARAEAQVVFASLARRFPRMALATNDVRFRDSITLRGLESLPVLLEGD